MKKLISAVIFVLFLISPVASFAEETENKLTVSGNYTILEPADEAYVTIGVKTGNIDYVACQEENKNKMNDVIKAIKSLGIEERHIKTIEYNSVPIYEYIKTDEYTGIYYNGTYYNKRVLKEYQITHMIRVMVTDLSLVGKLVDITVASGVNELNNIQFSLSKPKQHELYLAALEGAAARAKDKAEVLAKSFGIKTLKIKTITVDNYNVYDNYSYNKALVAPGSMGDAYSNESSFISGGEIQVSASVYIEYTY